MKYNSALDSLYNGYTKNVEIEQNFFSSNSIKQVIPEVEVGVLEPAGETFSINAVQIGGADPNSREFKSETVTAYEASKHTDGDNNIDIRPRLLNANNNQLTLLDSGSQVSVVRPDPEDSVDKSLNLESVNGQKIQCYGKKKISGKYFIDLFSFLGRRPTQVLRDRRSPEEEPRGDARGAGGGAEGGVGVQDGREEEEKEGQEGER